MNKKGMTLLELMIYIAIAGLLLAPVVMLMRDSSVNMARSAANTDLRMSGRDILNTMYEDIRNLGFKVDPDSLNRFKPEATYLDSVPNSNDDEEWEVYWSFVYDLLDASNPSDDASSFWPYDNESPFDSLDFIKGVLRDDGKWDKTLDVRYSVRNIDNTVGALTRTQFGTPASTHILASNIIALQFQYAVDLTDGVWYNSFENAPNYNASGTTDVYKSDVQFIKVSIIMRDPKQLAAAKPSPVTIGNYTHNPTDNALYERHEIVIPVPNNGLFPPNPFAAP